MSSSPFIEIVTMSFESRFILVRSTIQIREADRIH
jgi:hypothetical protein